MLRELRDLERAAKLFLVVFCFLFCCGFTYPQLAGAWISDNIQWKVISGLPQAGATLVYFNANGKFVVTYCVLNKNKSGLPFVVIQDGTPAYAGTLNHSLPTKVKLRLIGDEYHGTAKPNVGMLAASEGGIIVLNHDRLRRLHSDGSEKELLSDLQRLVPESMQK